MKALLCKQWGPPEDLVVEDVPSPVPGPGQVVVSVKAAGVNYPDALVVQGKHQYKPQLPFRLGSEVSGIVKETGPGVTSLKPGDRVYGGGGTRGSFAEEMLIDAIRLQPIPPGTSFEEAAAIPITYNCSYYALISLAQLKAGESLLVLGAAGGVGIAAIQIAKAVGARVIAAASSPAKLAVCKASGADELIDYKADNLREKLREIAPTGVNVVYDPVGGDYAEMALRGLAWRGRYLVVGFADGIPKIPLNLVLLKNGSVIGVFQGEMLAREPEHARACEEGLAKLVAGGHIRPHVSTRYRLDQVPEALNALLNRQATGKLIVVP